MKTYLVHLTIDGTPSERTIHAETEGNASATAVLASQHENPGKRIAVTRVEEIYVMPKVEVQLKRP
jgi:hypothetical protein